MNIFEKYGGRDFWRSLVSDFFSRLRSDPQLSRFFASIDPVRMEQAYIELLQLTVGNGRGHFRANVKIAHAKLDIQRADFDQFLQILRLTVRDRGVSDSDEQEIAAVMTAFRDDLL